MCWRSSKATTKDKIMKMKATIEVEFEADERQTNPKHILEVALTRGVGQLASSIEYGISARSVPTGIKRGANPPTTKIKVVKQEIVG
jgi:hypothetical protein